MFRDVALDPVTEHGHDGIVDGGRILKDATIERLVEQGLAQAAAGCDILAPSDMMDGRVGALRAALEAAGFQDAMIMSYAAKYASCLLRPLPERRLARGSSDDGDGRQSGRQEDLPDGLRQFLTRRCAEVAPRYRRGGRHGDGQARHALPRHRPPRGRRLRPTHLRVPGLRRVRDDHGCRPERLARPGPRDPGVAGGFFRRAPAARA